MNNGTVKVLLVEDNPGDAQLLEEALAEAPSPKFELVHVTRLTQALDCLARQAFNVVLLDLTLPDGAGIDTVNRTRLAAPSIPIVVMTGLSDETFAVKAVQNGAQDYLVKGQIESDVLVRSLRYAIERNRLLTERSQLEEQLRQAQKMEAIGQLAGGVAHDFNNILTVIQGHTELLLTEAKSVPKWAESLGQIQTAADRAANLTRQLLAFSRRQMLRRRVVDLNEVVAGLASMLQRLLGEQVDLKLCCDPDNLLIKADAGMIEQIILNLAVNARDAMPRGGRLEIGATRRELDAPHTLRNSEARAGDFVCLSVSDTGCGMDAAVLNRIFEPFFTTKEAGRGTGLGLSMVYGIVKQHEGWIEVESRVGVGSKFNVFLPRSKARRTAATTAASTLPSPNGAATVLIVEDEATLRHLVGLVLERQGYTVLQAATGVAAVGVWNQHQAAVDLLITDMVMPDGLSGRELAKQLLAEKPGLKVIYTSGYCLELGEDELPHPDRHLFLQKPYPPQKLVRTVQACLYGTTTNHRIPLAASVA